jgi:hypothetical protein
MRRTQKNPPSEELEMFKLFFNSKDWQINGPFTYYPRVTEEIVLIKKEEIIMPNAALCLESTKTFVDSKGVTRFEGLIRVLYLSGTAG